MDRKTFLQELQLREQIRGVIRVVHKKRSARTLSEEQVLRNCIRKLIREVAE